MLVYSCPSPERGRSARIVWMSSNGLAWGLFHTMSFLFSLVVRSLPSQGWEVCFVLLGLVKVVMVEKPLLSPFGFAIFGKRI